MPIVLNTSFKNNLDDAHFQVLKKSPFETKVEKKSDTSTCDETSREFA